MGAYLGRTGVVTDGMIQAAALSIPDLLTDEDLAAGRVYPDINRIRYVVCVVGGVHQDLRFVVCLDWC